MTDTTQATDPFNGRLETAVLQRSTPAIDTELGRMYYVETLRAMDQDRLIRVSHPTALREPVYVLVTCEVVDMWTAQGLLKSDPKSVAGIEKAEAATPPDNVARLVAGLKELYEDHAACGEQCSLPDEMQELVKAFEHREVKPAPAVEAEAAKPAEEGTVGDTTLESGKRYRLQYLRGKRRREAVLTYLGIGFRGLDFDARPMAGTQSFLPSDLLSAEQVPDDTEPYTDRKVG